MLDNASRLDSETWATFFRSLSKCFKVYVAKKNMGDFIATG